MTADLLDRATREAVARVAQCTGSLPAPRYHARVYAGAIMRVVEVGRREGEAFYDAYRRVRAQPSVTVVALVLIHRDQFERESRVLMH